MKRSLVPAVFLLTSACLGLGDTSTSTVLDFDFNLLGQGFVAGAADFPVAQEGAVGAVGDYRPLPASLTSTIKGLFLKGTGVSGDLFLFQKRRFTGYVPNSSLTASISLEYITDYHAGCTTGPGPVTYIKAGVLTDEPFVTSIQGVYRMSIDKGTGTSPGVYTQFGDIRNGLTLCPISPSPAARVTVSQTQTAPLITDNDGAFWLFIGTQSSFAGTHEIYFTRLRLSLR